MTAVDKLDDRRIDHQGFVPEIWAGLVATALYMMQLGPNISTLSNYFEDVLVLCMFLGGVICLVGTAIGTKWFFPKAHRRTSYVTELFGLPLLIAVLGVYTYASVDPGSLLLSAMAGGLGLTIEIGCLRLFVDLVQQVYIGDDEGDEDDDNET